MANISGFSVEDYAYTCERLNGEDKIFALTPSGSGTAVTENKDNVFQMCFADPNQGSASAQYIADQKLGTKIGIIYKNDDAYSSGIYDTFQAKAAELGLNIVSTTTFTTDSQNDFTVQLQDAKNAGADLLFLPMYYDAASLILGQAANMDYAPKFFGVDGMDGILTLEGFDTATSYGYGYQIWQTENGFGFTASTRLFIGDRIRIQPDNGDEGPALTMTKFFVENMPATRVSPGQRVFVCCDKAVPLRGQVFKLAATDAEIFQEGKTGGIDVHGYSQGIGWRD